MSIETAVVRVLDMIYERGVHSRTAARFVQTVERFKAEVWVTRGEETVRGDSILGLLYLSGAPGPAIIEVIGPQAVEVADALEALFSRRIAEK
jgi:phosphocarrier protein HPr